MSSHEVSETASWRGSLNGHVLLAFSSLFSFSIGLALIIPNLSKHDSGLFWGLVFLLLAVWIVISNSPLYGQRLTVTNTDLQYPKGWFRRGSIPLDSISGVGLVWSVTLGDMAHVVGKGWALTVWVHGQEGAIRFPQFLYNSKIIGFQPKQEKPINIPDDLPSLNEQWASVASSKPAIIAVDLFQRTIARQASSGYLATEALQLHQSMTHELGSYTFYRGIWSPDGTLRRQDYEHAAAHAPAPPSAN